MFDDGDDNFLPEQGPDNELFDQTLQNNWRFVPESLQRQIHSVDSAQQQLAAPHFSRLRKSSPAMSEPFNQTLYFG